LPLSDYSKVWLSSAWPVLAAEAKAAMAVRNQAAASVAPPRSGVYPGSWKPADTATATQYDVRFGVGIVIH